MANHRAETRARTRRPSSVTTPAPTADGRARDAGAGRRRDPGAHLGDRQTLRRVLPSLPTLVGASALVLAVTGVLTVTGPAESPAVLAAAHVDRADAGGSPTVDPQALESRRRVAVSRDARRDAVRDAADDRLRATAEKQATRRKAALARLTAAAERQAARIAERSWKLPVDRGAYRITSRFGQCSGLWSHCHTGLDFAAPSGTPIHAIAGGTITEAGYSGAYGNRTVERLQDGTELWYCHQTAFTVRTGQKVRAGEVIGSVGSTGNTTGPHVHVEVRPSEDHPVDPYRALVAHGLKP